MQDDSVEHNPGREAFWVSFYDDENGRLMAKEQSNRKADEIKTGGSLMDHYEWFMQYDMYEDTLISCLRPPPVQPLRVLHVGCGNSDFCDHFPLSLGCAFPAAPPPVTLNVDICGNIIAHLTQRFPERLYAVGNCCSMTNPSASFQENEWYCLDEGTTNTLVAVKEDSVDLVFDKGTLDALMSSFAGEYNPNVEAYAQQILEVLSVGGIFFTISINSEEVVNSYFLSAGCTNSEKCFALVHNSTIELKPVESNSLRVETLGTRYKCYAYRVMPE